MPVRDRIADGLTRLAKVFGTTEPAPMRTGEIAAGMTPTNPFSPGQPIGPFDGFNRNPRTHNFVTGYNIAARPRSHERVAFETLRGLIDAYDVAQMCIWHRIDSIRALEWSLVAAKGFSGDVADAIPLAMAALKKPDRVLPFDAWLAAYLYDVLAYDAGTLYRIRNRAGRAIGLRVVDGTTIAPLLDYWGNPPQEPAEAYVQYVNGLPWNWLTRGDLIYVPFRKVPGSPYGKAPLETILLNANTDLRFQAYFLQRFTEGNVPEAFASAPESWTPNQIEQFQQWWDAFMLGDQAIKSQIKWIPGGGKIEWSNEKDFSDHFSLFLMRKTAAAYHVVPADLGFTENVNRSSGESQADVQHRVGDLPLINHVQGILTSFLQDDLGLPLAFAFDIGEEQADRYQQAQADKIYVDMGAISASEVRERRYGLPEPDGIPVPRYVFTTRSGPIPLSALFDVAGPVDAQTAAPEPGAPLPHEVFRGVEGVLPNPPLPVPPLAAQLYGPSALPPAPVGKDATAGITAGTGITSYDLVRHDEGEEDEEEQSPPDVVKAELAAFRSFRAKRRRAGVWRDFQFRAVGPVRGHRLNDAGRLAVRKAAGQVAVAGLAVHAQDTGRVLMLQRALTEDDPAAGCWEFPGGHAEGDESPLQAAWREWSEETTRIPPAGQQTGSWITADGVYQGIVWTVPSEDCVPVGDGRGPVGNPDDPDGDAVEAIAWWDPEQLVSNPAVRPELLATLDQVFAALGIGDGEPQVLKVATLTKAQARYRDPSDLPGKHCGNCGMFRQPATCTLVQGLIDPAAVCDHWDPRRNAMTKAAWPGWRRDQATAAVWTPRIRAALREHLDTGALAHRWLREHPAVRKDAGDGQDAANWLDTQGLDLAALLTGILTGIWSEGYVIGILSARAVLTGSASVDWSAWTPGDPQAALLVLGQDGAGSGLQILLDQAGVSISSIAQGRIDKLAKALAQALERGDSADTLAAALRAVLDDPQWADMVAITELARATSAASMNSYRDNGIEATYWATADDDRVCVGCEENESQGAVPLGAAFPSSDVSPPGHPLCRCTLIPAVVSRADVDASDLAAANA